ncbi:MAG: ABC transporter permease [candidate division Zixibacteria bacterium]|nr:ABC transporter permease [candidate division Zixibacteria bacterium]MDD5425998.1 ABC transporter permease [candidate division Zixibacteria bacterium]
MSKFAVILKREYIQVVKKKSFLIGVFLTPALMAAFMLIPAWLAQKKATSSEKMVVVDCSGTGMGERFVKELEVYKLENSDIPYYEIKQVFVIEPEDTVRFRALDDSLKYEINEKNLKYSVVIKPQPHLSDDSVYVVTNSDNFTSLTRFESRLSNLISSVKLEQTNINLPVDSVLKLTRRIDLKTQNTKGEAIPFQVKYFGGLIFVMLMFGMIVTYGSLVMRSVIEEKNSRIMEVLVSSVSPFQLMLGKIIGLGAATFTQVAIWVLIGAILFAMSGSAGLVISSDISRLVFNPVIVVFFVLFMIMGYLMYSTIFALIGSIVNNEKEAQSFIFPITMSLILPVMVGIHIVQEPYSTLSLALSFIPFFAPTTMMLRIIFLAPAATQYSFFSGILGESILSFIILTIMTVVIVWLTARIFRVGILMYGKRPTFPEIVKWIKY